MIETVQNNHLNGRRHRGGRGTCLFRWRSVVTVTVPFALQCEILALGWDPCHRDIIPAVNSNTGIPLCWYSSRYSIAGIPWYSSLRVFEISNFTVTYVSDGIPWDCTYICITISWSNNYIINILIGQYIRYVIELTVGQTTLCSTNGKSISLSDWQG